MRTSLFCASVLALFGLAASPALGAPTDESAAVREGVALVRSGEFEKAVIQLDGLVTQWRGEPRLHPELGRALVYLAVAYHRLDQTAKARGVAAEAFHADPTLKVTTDEFPPPVVSFFDSVRPGAKGAPAPGVKPAGGGGSGKKVALIGLGVAGVGGVVAAAAGGGGGSSTPDVPAAPTRASVTATITPNPVTAYPCDSSSCDPGYEYYAQWRVEFRESAGIGANVDFFNSTIRSSVTGQELPPLNIGASEIIRIAGTNHIQANGVLVVPQGVEYRFALGDFRGTLILTAQLHDERGNLINVTTQAQVQANGVRRLEP